MRGLIIGEGHHALNRIENFRQFLVLRVGHFKTVSLRVAARGMDVRRVAIKKRGRRIVEANDIRRPTVFNLNAKQPLGNRRQIFHRAKPAADNAAHAGATGVFAIRPAANRGRLRQARSHLPGPNIKPPGAFQRMTNRD